MELKSTNAAKANKLENFLIFQKNKEKKRKFPTSCLFQNSEIVGLQTKLKHTTSIFEDTVPSWSYERLYPTAFRVLFGF